MVGISSAMPTRASAKPMVGHRTRQLHLSHLIISHSISDH